ncbi:PREDICTED: fatty acid synthase-like [Priapulus caudatus]|uniref:Fatty acid synthase-like n=1 Tax=Priapulus caudatus TaxID=37621 RepID=A0ABM1EDI4_PRICU|nr:PREDICTED: fatty acid synthase-like [Priapulus caudatus]
MSAHTTLEPAGGGLHGDASVAMTPPDFTVDENRAESADDIVVAGISCRLPEADNMAKFKQNLFDGVDMSTADGRRWEPGIYGLPSRSAKLKDISKFDAIFFGISPTEANCMDPQLRILLEVTYEAIVDAGCDPLELRGSRTAVFVGASMSEAHEVWSLEADTVSGETLTGSRRSMLSNRLSFYFDLRGPSYAIDTACSSSLYAVDNAVAAIRSGQCDSAIVGGVNLNLKPQHSLQYHKLGMLSPDGVCKSFDAAGNGYGKAEGAVVVLLQRRASARRAHVTIIHSKSNTDGFKEQGASQLTSEGARLVMVAGRTPDGVTSLLAAAAERSRDGEFLALLDHAYSSPTSLHPYRGYALLNTDTQSTDVQRVSGGGDRRPIWFVCSGTGAQWAGMACDMMRVPAFRQTISRLADTLAGHGVDLRDVISASGRREAEKMLENSTPVLLSSVTAVQVALIDVLHELGVCADGIVGYSLGEIACAYADGGITAEMAVLIAYNVGRCVSEAKLSVGKMATIGLTWEETRRRCPADVTAACHNSRDSVTISGPAASVDAFIAELRAADVFVGEVATSGVAFHSHEMARIATDVKAALSDLPVCGLCYASGVVGIDVGKLLPTQPRFPVSQGTPMLGPLVTWDHSQTWAVPTQDEILANNDNGCTFEIDLSATSPDRYLLGHVIDGEALFPATGYLVLVWRAFAAMRRQSHESMTVQFHDIDIQRAAVMHADDKRTLGVNIMQPTGDFEVTEEDTLLARGRITAHDVIDVPEPLTLKGHVTPLPLRADGVYRELRMRGYDYSGAFRTIVETSLDVTEAKLAWTGNWVAFLDSLLQLSVMSETTRALRLPTRIQSFKINPALQLQRLQRIGDTPVLYAHVDHVIRKCTAGGAEITGLHTIVAPRRHRQHDRPTLERYVFAPYVDDVTDAALRAYVSGCERACCRIVSSLASPSSPSSSAAAIPDPRLLAEICARTRSDDPEVKVATAPTPAPPASTPAPPALLRSALEMLDKVVAAGLHGVVDAMRTSARDAADALHQVAFSGHSLKIVVDVAVENLNVWSRSRVKVVEVVDPGEQRHLSAEVEPDEKRHLAAEVAAMMEATVDVELVVCGDDDDGGAAAWHVVVGSNAELVVLDNVLHGRSDARATLQRALACVADGGFLLVAERAPDFLLAFDAMTSREAPLLAADAWREVFVEEGLEIIGEPKRRTATWISTSIPESRWDSDLAQLSSADYFVNNLIQTCAVKVDVVTLSSALESGDDEVKMAEHAYANVATPGDLSSVRWYESPLRHWSSMAHGEHRELCSVSYAALNARDAMLATGKLSPDAIPGHVAMGDGILGMEFSGHGSDGRRIMGLLSAQGLATTIDADVRFTWPVPESWTLQEAATVPLAYATAYYALIVRGEIRKGERVLIHCGSGDVGQAAISVALHRGCEVFTTVGSHEEREYLKHKFPQLQGTHFSNSRDASFEQEILIATNGKGNIGVPSSWLNSLAGLCGCSGALFVCLAHNMAASSTSRMAPTDDCSDASLRMAFFCATSPSTASSSTLSSSPTTTTREACGPLVGRRGIEGERLAPSWRSSCVAARSREGGAALACAGGACRQGAGAGYQQYRLAQWRALGVRVEVSKMDASVEAQARQLIDVSHQMAPVGGLFHLAEVRRDGPFRTQTPLTFSEGNKPKMAAAVNLDLVTRDTCATTLDWFVVFSSVCCGRGNAGQTNYGYANSTVERICERRQRDGFPAPRFAVATAIVVVIIVIAVDVVIVVVVDSISIVIVAVFIILIVLIVITVVVVVVVGGGGGVDDGGTGTITRVSVRSVSDPVGSRRRRADSLRGYRRRRGADTLPGC